jgi:hypothetical protein
LKVAGVMPGRYQVEVSAGPVVFTGAFGNPSSSRGLGLFGSTSMTLSGTGEGSHLAHDVDARHEHRRDFRDWDLRHGTRRSSR